MEGTGVDRVAAAHQTQVGLHAGHTNGSRCQTWPCSMKVPSRSAEAPLSTWMRRVAPGSLPRPWPGTPGSPGRPLRSRPGWPGRRWARPPPGVGVHRVRVGDAAEAVGRARVAEGHVRRQLEAEPGRLHAVVEAGMAAVLGALAAQLALVDVGDGACRPPSAGWRSCGRSPGPRGRCRRSRRHLAPAMSPSPGRGSGASSGVVTSLACPSGTLRRRRRSAQPVCLGQVAPAGSITRRRTGPSGAA